MKSGEKMKQILSGGVTGILVSHSVSQVREMCNKILWLDHGKQVGFTDKVDLYCDAYEEFLITKKLPKSQKGIENLAAKYQVRLKKRQEKLLKTQEETMLEALQNMNPDTAKKIATAYLESLNAPQAETPTNK